MTLLSKPPISSDGLKAPIPPVLPRSDEGEKSPMPMPSKIDMPPMPPNFPKIADTQIELKQSQYVSKTIIDQLANSLGKEVLEKVPYEDNGKITFENLVLFLSKTNTRSIDNTKSDKRIIDKQIELLVDIKNDVLKSTQDGQTSASRKAIAEDIKHQLNTFDELSNQASFNNRPLNKTINDLKVGATRSDNIGNTRFETGASILTSGKVLLSFLDLDNKEIKIREVEIGSKPNTGLGVLSEAINDSYDKLHIKASFVVKSTASNRVEAGNISNLSINNVHLGNINEIRENDLDGKLISAINNLTYETGVIASIDGRGHLELLSKDGRGIVVAGEGIDILSLDTQPKNGSNSLSEHSNYGRLTLVKNNANDIKMLDNEATKYIGFSKDKVSESTINLRYLKGLNYNAKEALSIGASPNNNSLIDIQIRENGSFPSSTTRYQSSIVALEILNSSISQLMEIKNSLGENNKNIPYDSGKMDKGLLVSKSV